VKPAPRRPLLACLALLLCGPCAAASFSARVQDIQGRPLRDAAVYLVPAAGDARRAAPPGRAVIEQHDREFIPFVTVVRTGAAVTFPNRDQMLHHVYSFSPSKSFQIKLYEGDPPNPIVFDKPGVVAVGCNIHDWMQAYVLVVDTPHFAITDDKGRARVEGLSSGAYELRVWHPHGKAEWHAPVQVADDPRGPIAVTLDTRVPARKAKPPLDFNRY
jgi:plastocyanin